MRLHRLGQVVEYLAATPPQGLHLLAQGGDQDIALLATRATRLAHPATVANHAVAGNSTPEASPERLPFRIDFPRWLAGLGERDRRIAADMMHDEPTRELAARHRLSQGRISQLRRQFHRSWRRFHGEAD